MKSKTNLILLIAVGFIVLHGFSKVLFQTTIFSYLAMLSSMVVLSIVSYKIWRGLIN